MKCSPGVGLHNYGLEQQDCLGQLKARFFNMPQSSVMTEDNFFKNF